MLSSPRGTSRIASCFSVDREVRGYPLAKAVSQACLYLLSDVFTVNCHLFRRYEPPKNLVDLGEVGVVCECSAVRSPRSHLSIADNVIQG